MQKDQTKRALYYTRMKKTIAAFLNTEGGTLFVGVSDDGKILGIEDEMDLLHGKNKDKFLLDFKNILNKEIGRKFLS